jgi:DNA-binding HxlR family transcriptional regulator
MAWKKGYGQYCPVAQAAEMLAERWTPRVVRELFTADTTSVLPVLVQRLREARDTAME